MRDDKKNSPSEMGYVLCSTSFGGVAWLLEI